MYVCHNYNLEVIKTTIIGFSARQVVYPIGQLVAFKGQLQRFHKLSLFDRFRNVENGLDINF